MFFGGQDGVAYALDADSGRVIWQKDFGNAVTTCPNDLLVLADDRALLSLDLSTNRVRWSVRSPDGSKWDTARPYVWKGEVLAGDDKGYLFAYRLSDGSLACSHSVSDQMIRGIGFSEDTFYAGTIHGMVYAFTAPAK